MDKEKLYNLPHLSSFSVENILTDIGLYSPLLIDLICEKNSLSLSTSSLLINSDDSKRLFELVKFHNPHMLPCYKCNKEQAFLKCAIKNDSEKFIDDIWINHGYDKKLESDGCYKNNKNKITQKFKNEIISSFSSFSIKIRCAFEATHIAQFFFLIETIEPDIESMKLVLEYKLNSSSKIAITDKQQKAIDYVNFCNNTLIITKIGQNPSIADLQFNDLQKYKKILKYNYRELTKAVGLHANGVGIGAFVYLRRLFENLVEEVHKECIELDKWDENEYKSKRFNEKIKYMEGFEKFIIPNEIQQIKDKLYGVISKGIHEYTEDECMEMFPFLLLSIKLILDKRLDEINRKKQIEETMKKINSARS